MINLLRLFREIAHEKNSNSPFNDSPYHIDQEESPFYDQRKIKKNKLFTIQTENIKIKKRGRQMVPKLFWPSFSPGNVNEREDYYRRLLMLFKPWRNETEDLKLKKNEDYETNWLDFLATICPRAKDDILSYMGFLENLRNNETEICIRRKKLFAKTNDAPELSDDENEEQKS
jgi:hypothetical protein